MTYFLIYWCILQFTKQQIKKLQKKTPEKPQTSTSLDPVPLNDYQLSFETSWIIFLQGKFWELNFFNSKNFICRNCKFVIRANLLHLKSTMLLVCLLLSCQEVLTFSFSSILRLSKVKPARGINQAEIDNGSMNWKRSDPFIRVAAFSTVIY